MKNLYAILSLIIPTILFSQNVKWGLARATIKQELLTENPGSGRFYNRYPINILAGQTMCIDLFCQTENMIIMLNNAANETIVKMVTGAKDVENKGYQLIYKYTATKDESLSL